MSGRGFGQTPDGGLRELLAEALRGLGNSILSHLQGVQRITAEMASLDALSFEGTLGSSTLTQPSSVKLPSGYDFEMYGLSGYVENVGVSVDNHPRITFNCRQQGKRNVFSSDMSMASLVTLLGPQPPLIWARSLWLFDAGSDIQVTFARPTGWVGADKRCGVVLWGGLVRKAR
jgi:hypothetical protein